MIIDSLNINMFNKYIQTNSLILPVFGHDLETKIGEMKIDLITEYCTYETRSLQRGYCYIGNKTISSKIVFCNNIVKFIKFFKYSNFTLENTLFLFVKRNIRLQDLEIIKSINKSIYTYLNSYFDSFILNSFYHSNLEIVKEGYRYNNIKIPIDASLTEIHNLSKIRNDIKHLR